MASFFKLVPTLTAWRTVHFSIADEDGGTVTNSSIDLRFKLIDDDEIASLKETVASTIVEGDSVTIAVAKGMSPIVVDWRGVLDADDKPLPYSIENMARLLAIVPHFSDVAADEFRRARRGEPQVRLGNLPLSPADGQAAELAA